MAMNVHAYVHIFNVDFRFIHTLWVRDAKGLDNSWKLKNFIAFYRSLIMEKIWQYAAIW